MTTTSNNSNKPHCFADDDYYSDTSSSCKGCGYRQLCANQISTQASTRITERNTPQVSNEVNYYRPRSAPTTTTSTSPYTTSSQVATSAPSSAYTTQNNYNKPVVMRSNTGDFNFQRDDLGRQFTTYLMYDMAEVATERLHSFIVASKENYRNGIKK